MKPNNSSDSNDFVTARREAAKIIIDVLLGRTCVLEALKKFPKNTPDPSVRVCFHILLHFEADEDLRKKDALYKETQDDFLVDCAQTLIKGEPLPCNVINEYKEFYGEDLFYPDMNKKNIIKRLKKNINL